MNTYIAYARKSSEADDRQALSIESQLAELHKLASTRHVSIAQTFTEQKSAKAPGRIEFGKVVALVESGKANALLVWNSDRLARNSVDSGRLIYLFDIGKLQEIVTPTQTFTNTPNDKFLLSILWGHAKLENDNKSLNVRRGLDAKAQRGWYPFHAMNGYLNTPDREKGLKIIKTDPLRFPLVRKMWDMLLSGNYTVAQIHQEVTEKWGYTTPDGNKLSRSRLYEMFKSVFYTGFFSYKGEVMQGNHEPMITKEEYDRAQDIISGRRYFRPLKHDMEFKGVLRCKTCGFSIVGTRKIKEYLRTNRTAHYDSYRCSHMSKAVKCTQPPVSASELDKQFSDLFASLQIDKDFLDWANEYFDEVYEYEHQQERAVDTARQNTLLSLQRQLDVLLDMKLKGEVTSEEYAKKKGLLTIELNSLKKAQSSTDTWRHKAKRSLDVAYLASEKYKTASPEERRAMIREVNSNLFLEDKKIVPMLEKPFFLMQQMNSVRDEEKGKFELPKEPYLKPKTLILAQKNPVKYPRQESNLRFTG